MPFSMGYVLSFRSALQYLTSEDIAQWANIDKLTEYFPLVEFHHILAVSLAIAIVFSCE